MKVELHAIILFRRANRIMRCKMVQGDGFRVAHCGDRLGSFSIAMYAPVVRGSGPILLWNQVIRDESRAAWVLVPLS